MNSAMEPRGQMHVVLAGLDDPKVRLEVKDLAHLAVIGVRHDGRITFWNRGAERLLGYSSTQVENVDFGDLLRTPGQRAWAATILDPDRPIPFHRASLSRRDGAPVACMAHGNRDSAGVHLFLSPCQPVSSGHEQPAAGEASGMDPLAVLAGGIAHDFNNLLLGMVGNADLALMELPGDSSVRDHVEQVAQAGLRAADLCRQLMAFSGNAITVKETLDLSDLISHATPLVQMSLGPVPLRLDLTAELPDIEGDTNQLRQVLMNLLTNAAEAIDGRANGRVAVRTRLHENSYGGPESRDLPPGRYAIIEVQDNGTGMDPDQVARAFEPFFTTKFMGRGLGLAAAQGIVRAHHGTISLCSSRDEGTTVTVALPVKGLRAAIPTPPSTQRIDLDEARPGGRRRVLVVDDEAHVRTVANGILRHAEYDVVLAEHGGAALAILAEDPAAVDLVLLDMTMPGLDGLEVLQRVRQVRRDLPVLLSSGYGPEKVSHVLDADPHCQFLAKPYRRQVLLDAVGGLLELSAVDD